MSRTTLDIESTILKEIKRLQKKEGGSMGGIVSRLLARALASDRDAGPPPREFRWNSRRMNALVDLADKEAVYAALDRDRE